MNLLHTVALIMITAVFGANTGATVAERSCKETLIRPFSVRQIVRVKDLSWPHAKIVVVKKLGTISQLSYSFGRLKRIEITYLDGTKEWREPNDITPQTAPIDPLKQGDEVAFFARYWRRQGRKVHELRKLEGGHIQGFFADQGVLVRNESGELFAVQFPQILPRLPLNSTYAGLVEGMAVRLPSSFEGWIVALYADGTAVVRDDRDLLKVVNAQNLQPTGGDPQIPSPRFAMKHWLSAPKNSY